MQPNYEGFPGFCFIRPGVGVGCTLLTKVLFLLTDYYIEVSSLAQRGDALSQGDTPIGWQGTRFLPA
jgi:hypothetical protein